MESNRERDTSKKKSVSAYLRADQLLGRTAATHAAMARGSLVQARPPRLALMTSHPSSPALRKACRMLEST